MYGNPISALYISKSSRGDFEEELTTMVQKIKMISGERTPVK
jgi:hypothetical protein